MRERNQFLLLILQDAGATPLGTGLTLRQLRNSLARYKVFADTKTISNWLQQPISSGWVIKSGVAGGPFYDPGSEGYKYKVSSKGGAWLAATLNLVIPEGESETEEPEAEGSAIDSITGAASEPGSKPAAEGEAEAGESVIDKITEASSGPEPGVEKVNDFLPEKKDSGVISGATLLLLGTLAGLAYYSPPVRRFLTDWWSRNFPKKSKLEETPETPTTRGIIV